MSSPENKIAIDEYIANNTSSIQQETVPVMIKGKRELLKVYSIPLDHLYFNIKNGRFKAEYLELVRKNGGKELDPTDEIDSKKIQKLLLDLDPIETKRTTEDIRQRGQWQPGIMTHDGFVIDGNRRLSILTKLTKDDKKFSLMKVARLPPNVDKNDLWKLEAGIQLGKDEIVKYGPINELLKLKEGIDAGLSELEISHTLYGYDDDKEIKRKLERLRLIDEFLEFNGTPQKYSVLTKTNKVEHFVDAQRIINYLKDRSDDPGLKKDIKRAIFGLIQVGKSYHEIRKIREILKLESIKAIEFLRQIAQTAKPKFVEKEISIKKQDLTDAQLDEQVKKTIDEVDELSDEDENSDKSPIGMMWIRAIEALNVDKNKGDMPRLLGNALDNLDAIDYSDEQLKTTQCKDLIEKILRHGSKLSKVIEE